MPSTAWSHFIPFSRRSTTSIMTQPWMKDGAASRNRKTQASSRFAVEGALRVSMYASYQFENVLSKASEKVRAASSAGARLRSETSRRSAPARGASDARVRPRP